MYDDDDFDDDLDEDDEDEDAGLLGRARRALAGVDVFVPRCTSTAEFVRLAQVAVANHVAAQPGAVPPSHLRDDEDDDPDSGVREEPPWLAFSHSPDEALPSPLSPERVREIVNELWAGE